MNLRALAKDYANGILGPQAYRKARDELIESIFSGSTKLTAHDFQLPLNIQRIEIAPEITGIQTSTDNKPLSQSPSMITTDTMEERVNDAPSPRGILYGGAALIVILVIAVVLYPFTKQKKIASADTSQISSPSAKAQPTRQDAGTINEGERLIKTFLQLNDWSDESLQQFISTWEGLSAAERENGLSSSASTEFANAIFRKLEDERIMMQGLGDAQSSKDKQISLVTFAQQVGINDPRIIVKETP